MFPLFLTKILINDFTEKNMAVALFFNHWLIKSFFFVFKQHGSNYIFLNYVPEFLLQTFVSWSINPHFVQ